jgi:hypothetical protein
MPRQSKICGVRLALSGKASNVRSMGVRGEADLAAAIDYVSAQGNDLERARLAVLTHQAPADEKMIALAAQDQQPDGGFAALWSDGQSSLDETCYRLSQIEDFGVSAARLVDGAVGFLSSRQRNDGTFEEDVRTSAAVPPWAQPGDPAALLYITANCAFTILDALRRQSPAERRRLKLAVNRAGSHLASRIGRDGRLPSFLHTHWLAGPVLRAAGFDGAADGLLWALAFRLSGLGPSALAWLAAAIPDEPVATEARDRLARLQEDDGHWRSEDGERHDVATTLTAIRVLGAGH